MVLAKHLRVILGLGENQDFQNSWPGGRTRLWAGYLFAYDLHTEFTLHLTAGPAHLFLAGSLVLHRRARDSLNVSGEEGGKGFSFLCCLDFLKTFEHIVSHLILTRGGDRVMWPQPYFMGKETKVESLGDLSRRRSE